MLTWSNLSSVLLIIDDSLSSRTNFLHEIRCYCFLSRRFRPVIAEEDGGGNQGGVRFGGQCRFSLVEVFKGGLIAVGLVYY